MNNVTLVEVGPRDGFQSIEEVIPTDRKIAIICALHDAGIRRMEVTSFVSSSAVPQLADAAEVLSAVSGLPDLDAQVLVPTARQAERALAAGAEHLAFVLSVSERHNQGNVRRSPPDSAREFGEIVRLAGGKVPFRLSIATAFDCPYLGRTEPEATLALIDGLLAHAPMAEVALCDTTGRAMPDQVGNLFRAAASRFGSAVALAFHAHDTFGLGAANAFAAHAAGVRVFDASVAGLGGCPFAPGATGNVASEDMVYLFEGMGFATGISLAAVAAVAEEIVGLPGGQTGGRVRAALAARKCAGSAA